MKLQSLLRFSLLICAMLVCTTPAQPAAALDEVAMFAPQVRLRKLHLVRPDLIHYPLSVEVIC